MNTPLPNVRTIEPVIFISQVMFTSALCMEIVAEERSPEFFCVDVAVAGTLIVCLV